MFWSTAQLLHVLVYTHAVGKCVCVCVCVLWSGALWLVAPRTVLSQTDGLWQGGAAVS